MTPTAIGISLAMLPTRLPRKHGHADRPGCGLEGFSLFRMHVLSPPHPGSPGGDEGEHQPHTEDDPQALLEGGGDDLGEEGRAGDVRRGCRRKSSKDLVRDHSAERVVAQEGGEQAAHGRQVSNLGGALGRDPLGGKTTEQGPRQFPGDPHDHEGKEDAHRKDFAGVYESGPDAGARAALASGKAVHDARRVGRHEQARGQPTHEEQEARNRGS